MNHSIINRLKSVHFRGSGLCRGGNGL